MLYDLKWDAKIGNEIVQILRRAKDLISNPRYWTCGEYARDSRRGGVDSGNSAAVSFCSIGALAVASGLSVKETEESGGAYSYLSAAATEQGFREPHMLNDEGGHTKAMAMFDRAIELAVASQ